MTIYCCFPGCGKIVYEYEKNTTLHKQLSHTIPIAERSGLAAKLKLPTNNLKRAQLLICSAHFRPEAYLPDSTRLRRDVPFVNLLILPDADPNQPLPPLPPFQPAVSTKVASPSKSQAKESNAVADGQQINQL